ncbi:MAG: (Fe-S)-binding protein [Acidobacteriota bacterium]|nr:(Fe-S)-binding protein [Acidobacteriota bacterium]
MVVESGPHGVLPGTEDGAVHGPRTLIDDCVHCGFCLPACPTYNSWSEEMDSPRGRIDLMRGLAEGTLAFNETVVAHFDRCLGCMGCVTACPSGVRYDVLIEETRAAIEKTYRRPVLDRLYRSFLFLLFPYPERLKIVRRLLGLYASTGLRRLVHASGLLEILPRRLAQLETLMPPVEERAASDVPALTAAVSPARARVGLVSGCVQRVFFPEVNRATVRALSAEGCEVAVPQGQGCCGALSMHAGRDGEALAFARALIERFEGQRLDAVIVNAAGCGSHLKDYGRLFSGDTAWASRAAEFSGRVRDVTEFLAELGPAAPRHPIALRVAYHDACHLAHAQRVREPPRLLLRGIPGIEILEVPDGDQCCGSAGIYNLTEPASADEIGGRKADNVLSTGAELLVSANPGCTLQIQKILRQRGVDLPAAHPIEILDASLRGAGVSAR